MGQGLEPGPYIHIRGTFRKAVILAGALSPAYLRVGGTNADFLHFGEFHVNETTYNASTFDYEFYEEEEIEANWPLKSSMTMFNMTGKRLALGLGYERSFQKF